MPHRGARCRQTRRRSARAGCRARAARSRALRRCWARFCRSPRSRRSSVRAPRCAGQCGRAADPICAQCSAESHLPNTGTASSDRFGIHRDIPALPFCHATLKSKKPNDSAYPVALKTIGDHVRARRLDLGLYQKDLARRLGVTTNTITNWEKNHFNPDLRTWPA